ncbi:hypothetical protein OAA09_00465 [bacterium]|nr:hypothetical protein [bacterium]
MSGILDKKTRILDTIVTFSGRQQIAAGNLKIEYVSFTDTHTFYEGDIVSGSTDATQRLFFEACSLPQDQITFESDDSGFMLPYRAGEVNSVGEKVLSGSSGNKIVSAVSEEIQFNSAVTTLLSSSIKNFDKNNILGSIDPYLDHNKFEVDKENIKFTITNDFPFKQGDLDRTSIDNVESLFQDKRLTHVANFLYLPPKNAAVTENEEGPLLGDYPRLGQEPMLEFDDLMDELKEKEKETITFYKTSLGNNIVGQFFEKGKTSFKKLDVIDFGEFETADVDFPEKHVFFVGKVFPDSKESYTFVNMFTLVFE